MLSLAVAANGVRMYTGCYAGVWRSDDGGRTWRQMTRPQPGTFDEEVAGALFAPAVFDLVVSPADQDLVLASGARGKFVKSRDGMYPVDGRRLQLDPGPQGRAIRRRLRQPGRLPPDDPNLAFAALGSALGVSTNAGATWVRRTLPGTVWHVAPGPRDAAGKRRVYAAGSGNLYASLDGGTTWKLDAGTAAMRTKVGGLAGATADNSGSGANVLAIDPTNPNHVFLAAVGAANGPSYYMPNVADGTICNTTPARGCGEGSIWFGDYTSFATTSAAQWSQLPGPPVYFGATSPSGNSFVVTKRTAAGFLVFFADESHVHVSVGKANRRRFVAPARRQGCVAHEESRTICTTGSSSTRIRMRSSSRRTSTSRSSHPPASARRTTRTACSVSISAGRCGWPTTAGSTGARTAGRRGNSRRASRRSTRSTLPAWLASARSRRSTWDRATTTISFRSTAARTGAIRTPAAATAMPGSPTSRSRRACCSSTRAAPGCGSGPPPAPIPTRRTTRRRATPSRR